MKTATATKTATANATATTTALLLNDLKTVQKSAQKEIERMVVKKKFLALPCEKSNAHTALARMVVTKQHALRLLAMPCMTT
jgi:hypothetical protein